jgi:hypothetical protein
MIYSLMVLSMVVNLLAPMPPGIAYNPETKECGYYMGGDEYASYLLPQPWVINYGDPIQIDSATHQWDGNGGSIESFCRELGYTYVEGNIATLYGTRTASPIAGIRMICKTIPFILLAVVVIVVILLIARRKKKRAKQNNDPKA